MAMKSHLTGWVQSIEIITVLTKFIQDIVCDTKLQYDTKITIQ